MANLSISSPATSAVSRTGRFVIQWGTLASSWCLRLTSVAAFLGVVIGMGGQLAILLFGGPAVDPSLEPSLGQRVVGVALTALAYSILGLLLAIVSSSWMRSPTRRKLAITVFTAVFTLVFAVNVVSTVVRILSGTHMTVGAVEFLCSSPGHFLHAALEGYAWSVRAALLGIVVFAVATAIRTASTIRAPGAPRFRSVTYLLAVLLLALVARAGSAQATLDHRVFASTAELAFAQSVRRSSGLRDVASDAPPELSAPAPD